MDGTGLGVVRADDEPREASPRSACRGGAVLDARRHDRARGARRNRQGALPHARRAPGRGSPDALPRRAPIALPLLAVRLPVDLHVLRHRGDAIRSQPERIRDPGPGTALQASGAREPRRVHGHGRAVPERRERVRVRAAPSRSRHHASAHDDLDRRLDARLAAFRRRRRGADPAGALDPFGRSRAALGAHAVNERYPLADVLAECRRYFELRRRKVFVEYVMLAGVNDSKTAARSLAALLDPRMFKVNLIPYNPTGCASTGPAGRRSRGSSRCSSGAASPRRCG